MKPCTCGGTGRVEPGYYPDWKVVVCDNCDRIEFGRTEEVAVAKWEGESE